MFLCVGGGGFITGHDNELAAVRLAAVSLETKVWMCGVKGVHWVSLKVDAWRFAAMFKVVILITIFFYKCISNLIIDQNIEFDWFYPINVKLFHVLSYKSIKVFLLLPPASLFSLYEF